MKRRVLLVDDDVTVLSTLQAVLELNDFEVETATSVPEASSKLNASVYHLVITDSRMETEDAGLRVIRVARRQTYNPATALLTAHPPEGIEWQQAGAHSFLAKPMGAPELLLQIEALLHRQACAQV